MDITLFEASLPIFSFLKDQISFQRLSKYYRIIHLSLTYLHNVKIPGILFIALKYKSFSLESRE